MNLLPYDAQFEIIVQATTGCVRRHFLADSTASDYQYLVEIAVEKASLEMQVDILPTLGNIDDPLRAIIFPDAIFAKSPDLRIDGVLWEVEQPTKPSKLNNLSHAIGAGAEQAHYVIINTNVVLDEYYMMRVAKGRFKLHKELQVIEFRCNGRYTTFKK